MVCPIFNDNGIARNFQSAARIYNYILSKLLIPILQPSTNNEYIMKDIYWFVYDNTAFETSQYKMPGYLCYV